MVVVLALAILGCNYADSNTGVLVFMSLAFFGKSSRDVSLAEAAYLAALPKAPTFYSPYGKNLERLEERRMM
mgnify:CR=1 FL=1